MNCIKCGREIPEDQVFCESCLTEMDNYPVKPGTAVHIPARTPEEAPKKPAKKKRVPTAEELLLRTRKKLCRARIFAVMLLLICGALSFLMAQAVLELDFQRILGQNYRTEKGKSATKPVSEWTHLVTDLTEPETEFPAPAEKSYVPDQEAEPEPAPEVVPTPTEAPTAAPTEAPTELPTEPATQPPTEAPGEEPTQTPTEAPAPTDAPAETPTEAPPATEPAPAPTEAPTEPVAPAETAPPTPAEPAMEPAADSGETPADE